MEDKSKRATWVFTCFVLAAAGIAVWLAFRTDVAYERPFVLGMPLLALAFGLAERFSVEIEVRKEAQSVNFAEIPLTIGIIFADPFSVIVGRLIGAGVGMVSSRRPPFIKVVFNMAVFAAETAAALLVFHWLVRGHQPTEPMGWVAALAAITAATLVSWGSVSIVIRLAGAPVSARSALRFLAYIAASAVPSWALAIAAAAALWQDGRSWVLLLMIGGAFGYFLLAYIRIRQRHMALDGLHRFASALERASGRDALVAQALHDLLEMLGARRVVAWIPTADVVEIYDADASGELNTSTHAATDHPLAAELAVASLLPGGVPAPRSLSVPDLDLSAGEAIATRLSLGDTEGLIVVEGRLATTRAFDEEDHQLLETAAGHLAAALRNAALVDELRAEAAFRARQATHDEVTDLPNSRGLAEALERQLAFGARLALLTIRIDSLREVNETLGRAMGDELLIQASARLRTLTEEGWCAKTGNDEFTLVTRGGDAEAEDLAIRIVEAFEAPVQCEDVALAITAGIGVALAPDHGREVEILLRRASLAASRSRVEGTRVTIWAADRDPYDPQRLAIAADLRDAIPAGELQVHFQPQVDIESGLVISAEALVRWRHPRLGELRPDQFISAAEYTGAIDALTEFVLTAASRTCAGWRAQGWDLDVSVNLSARNLANLAFADTVRRVLKETGLDPTALTLELTESSIMTEAAEAMTTLTAIHDLGVSLSIDDFGTGYSSLAHLRKLPVSEIKIDKSFVFDLTTNHNDEAIVRSMVSLGHHLGLTVVVEGVETVEVRRRLTELGADRIQGYLLSRPMPVDAFEQWIADRPVRMVGLSSGDAQSAAPEGADRDR